MSALVVHVHRWLTAEQLDYLFGLSQAAPGPNMMWSCRSGRSPPAFRRDRRASRVLRAAGTARAAGGPRVEALAWTSLDRHGPTRTHAGVNRPSGRRIPHVRDRPPQSDQSRLSRACRCDRRSTGASLNAETRQNRIAIDGEKVIACCRGFFSSIRRTAGRIQQKRPVFRAMASVVPFLKPSAPVARKG
jgi:hypothetical protein